MRILVTGAGGFLGRHLVRGLETEGHEIVAVVRREPEARFARFYGARTHIVRMDLENPRFAELPQGIDTLVALAQSSEFRSFPERAESIFNVNVVSVLRLLDWARLHRLQRFVLASSGGIYGPRARPFVEETDMLAVDSPLGFYLGSKLCSEIVLQNYRHFFGGSVILRPFFIYGPGQREDMLVPRLIASVREDRVIQLEGEEGMRFNPVYVEDAAKAFAAALMLDDFHVINVAGPQVLTLREACNVIGRQLGRAPRFEVSKARSADYVASIEAAKAKLGAPALDFAAGIGRALAD